MKIGKIQLKQSLEKNLQHQMHVYQKKKRSKITKFLPWETRRKKYNLCLKQANEKGKKEETKLEQKLFKMARKQYVK